MSISKKSTKNPRLRRSPAAARDNILAAAEALLLDKGPQALKLTDVAARAGIAHATVLHHFGTIADVQTALMERMIRELVARIVESHRAATDDERPHIGQQALFDAFETRGAARLAAWLELTGEVRRLTMVRDAVREVLASRVDRSVQGLAAAQDRILLSIVMAIGVGLFGRSLADVLGRPPETARVRALELLATKV